MFSPKGEGIRIIYKFFTFPDILQTFYSSQMQILPVMFDYPSTQFVQQVSSDFKRIKLHLALNSSVLIMLQPCADEPQGETVILFLWAFLPELALRKSQEKMTLQSWHYFTPKPDLNQNPELVLMKSGALFKPYRSKLVWLETANLHSRSPTDELVSSQEQETSYHLDFVIQYSQTQTGRTEPFKQTSDNYQDTPSEKMVIQGIVPLGCLWRQMK